MADKTARNSIILIGTGAAAVAGYFFWKRTQRGSAAGPGMDTAPARSTEPISPSLKGTKMTHILHIDSSPRGSLSHSRTVSGELVEAMKAAHSDIAVTYRDLGHQDIPFVTEAFIGAMYTPADSRTPEQKQLLTLSDELIAELKAADTYVFGVPMYNFGVPAVFKAYIDYVARAGETFNPATYEGLLKNKKAYVVSAHGGAGYGPGQERESMNQLVPTLRGVLGFMGVSDVEFVSVEATAFPEEAQAPIQAAVREKIAAIAKAS